MEPILIVHGGAGMVSDQRVPFKLNGVKKSARVGYEVLRKGGNALDAIEAAIHVMEDDEHFNAGYGSVLNLDGDVEMDASIMVGKTLDAGACSIVKDVKHPITLARKIMEKTPHVLLAAEGARKFAQEQGLEIVSPGALVTDMAKEALQKFKKDGSAVTEFVNVTNERGERSQRSSVLPTELPFYVDTVGCVVIDSKGNLFAGTSTGGISGKMVGRVSDTSQIGSGTYADDAFGAVSTTGNGEAISKYVLAHAIVREIENGKNAQEATRTVIDKMYAKLNKEAGAITISAKGDVGVAFSSKRMSWAYQKGNQLHFGINPGQDEVETL